MKTITLHAHRGPNPWKVALILDELSIPYETRVWDTADQKKPPFTTELNPNGFTPVIEDPNQNVTIWESGAIIQYLLETYDTKHKISFPTTAPADRAHLNQWSFCQAASQGPNLSFVFAFTRFTPNPEARERFVNDALRLLGVVNEALQGKEWLVGGKCTAADLVYVPYWQQLKILIGEDAPDLAKDFPNVDAWMQRMSSRASVQKVNTARVAANPALKPLLG